MHPQLKKIYKKIPKIACKGLCHNQCTIIAVSKIEREMIEKRLNFDPFIEVIMHDDNFGDSRQSLTKAAPENIRCPMLDANNRCSIYDIRPFLCRIFGVINGLKCDHGCEVESYISQKDATRLLIEIDNLK